MWRGHKRLLSLSAVNVIESTARVFFGSDRLSFFLLTELFDYVILSFSCIAPGHHNAVCEDPDGSDAQDLSASPTRVWLPRSVKMYPSISVNCGQITRTVKELVTEQKCNTPVERTMLPTVSCLKALTEAFRCEGKVVALLLKRPPVRAPANR